MIHAKRISKNTDRKNERRRRNIILLAILVSFCVFTDFRDYRIKNKVLIPGLIAGIVYQLIVHGIKGLLLGLCSMLIPFIVLYPLFCIRAFGAGDIKMMCMIALYMTPKEAIRFLVISFLVGGAIALGKACLERNIFKRFRFLFLYLKNCFLCKGVLDYGEVWTGTKKQKKTVIHFSLPIAVSTFIWIGGNIF